MRLTFSIFIFSSVECALWDCPLLLLEEALIIAAASGVLDREGSLLSLRILLFTASLLFSRCLATEDRMFASGLVFGEAEDADPVSDGIWNNFVRGACIFGIFESLVVRSEHQLKRLTHLLEIPFALKKIDVHGFIILISWLLWRPWLEMVDHRDCF